MEKAPYNHATGDFDAPRRIEPAEFLIVEGLLGLYSQSLRDHYDVSVYLDTPEPLRHRWKLSRDTAKRGYSASQVQDILEHREKVSAMFIRPQRDHADMVVRYQGRDLPSGMTVAEVGIAPLQNVNVDWVEKGVTP